MSKKKNTLKDLDEFLKQQAASLVTPAKLSDKVPTPEIQEPSSVVEKPAAPSVDVATTLRNMFLNDETREQFYDLIIRAAEGQTSPESTMLINTALYLKHGENWKEAIRQYWKNRK